MLDFFAIPTSAYCAKVRIVLDVEAIPYQEMPPPNGYGSADYQAIVPAGSIPAIRDGNFVLHDSDAILEYLEDRYPTPTMRSEDLERRAHLRAIARFHDTAFEPAVRETFPLIGRPISAIEETIVAATDKIHALLQKLELIIERTSPQTPFLGGDQLDLTDCGFAPTIQMTRILLEELEQELQLSTATVDWIGALSGDEHVARSLELCRGGLEDWIASKKQ